MPKVLRILNRLAVGGPVLNAAYLTKYLSPEFETLFVVGEREGHEQSAEHITEQLGINYVVVPGMGRSLNPLSDYGAYRRLKEIIRDFQPDIVHTHAAKPGALGRLAAAHMGVPVILHTFHGHVFHSYFSSWKNRSFIAIERFLAGRSDAIVTISEQQRRELAEEFRIAPAHKFHIVPLGFDLDRFRTDQQAKRSSFRAEFGLADDELAIGIIGRVVPIKNHQLFLSALRHVLQHTGRKVRAFIIGDGDMRPALEQQAAALGISTTTPERPVPGAVLHFTSWRRDIDRINAGMDIVCLTSLNEGTPVSLIEAQAANKPVVSTRVGGIEDIVENGVTGLLTDVQDEKGYADALLRLVNDEDLRLRLGSAGAERVLESFSYQRLVRDMSRLYRELLSRKGR